MTKKLFLALAVVGLLVACGAEASFNDADVTFAQGMIPHHQQGSDLATLALAKAENPKVLDLAERIGLAEDPEIATMRGWLNAWGKDEAPAATDRSGMTMGMISDEEMTVLAGTAGADFDRMFLQAMIRHHRGAIDMATSELTGGKSPDVKKLAQAMVSAQQAEIEDMTALRLPLN